MHASLWTISSFRLASVGAKFVYLTEPSTPEGRTWNPAVAVEDVATGSAAGPAAAFLKEHGSTETSAVALHQGRFVGRASVIEGTHASSGDLLVQGGVAPVAIGSIAI